MTERGLPPEGAPACPFVAFEDDRDARSTVPDHRHRCFAEARPAPRALAHQEAYCLSSAFPVCPTFQDWARREAAAARPTPVSGSAPQEVAPESHPMPPLDREAQHAAAYDAEPVPPRRNPPRDWAAPPPWTGDPAAAAAGGAVAGAAAAAGAAGIAGDGDPSNGVDGDDDLDPRADVPRVAARPASAGSSSSGTPDQDWGAESRGLAGSAAYRLAGPDPDEPEPAAPRREGDDAAADDWTAGAAAAAAAGTAWAASQPARTPQPASTRQPAPAPAPSARPSAPQAHPQQGGGAGSSGGSPTDKGRQDASDLFGPAWEAPRRYEAYPTLRTRVGLPSFGGVPRLALAAVAVLLVAVLLFFFGPMLLGFGKNDQGGGAAATATPVVQASDTPAPTAPPAPTPHTYVVAKGDTFSKIAKKFGVSVDELKAANPQVKNIDKIKIGDQLTIPEPAASDSAQP